MPLCSLNRAIAAHIPKVVHAKIVSEYDQEIPQSQTADKFEE